MYTLGDVFAGAVYKIRYDIVRRYQIHADWFRTGDDEDQQVEKDREEIVQEILDEVEHDVQTSPAILYNDATEEEIIEQFEDDFDEDMSSDGIFEDDDTILQHIEQANDVPISVANVQTLWKIKHVKL